MLIYNNIDTISQTRQSTLKRAAGKHVFSASGNMAVHPQLLEDDLRLQFLNLESIRMAVYRLFITDRSKAVVILWFYVDCFGVRASMTFHLMFVHIIFTST